MPRPLVPDRRGRILAAARELLLDRGWPATAVADIAERAGIGKGAVYREFPDKSAVLAAVLQRSARALTAQVHRRVLAAEHPLDLATVYRFGVEALLADPLMRALYVGDRAVLGEHVQGVTDDRYVQRFGWLADYVRRLQRAGAVDPAIPTDTVVRLLAVFTVGLVHAPGTLGATTGEELAATVELFAVLVGRGLATGAAVDVEAVREAHLALLDRLGAQQDLLAGAS